jgi:SAM-dependent methyltransferase
MDAYEKGWDHPKEIEALDPYRELFREASSDLVRRVFSSHLPQNGRILEIGSGLGELVSLVPEYKGQMQQTDQGRAIIARHRELHSDSNIMQADVYDLHFPEKTFDAVVGYAAFDVLLDIKKALREVKKILRPDGRFIHFIDVESSANPVFYLCSQSGCVPFPLFDAQRRGGLYFVNSQDVPRIRSSIDDPHWLDFFDLYLSDPEGVFMECEGNSNGVRLMMALSKIVEKSSRGRPVKFNEYSKGRLERGLAEEGYVLINSRNMAGMAVLDRDERFEPGRPYNIFYNFTGIQRERFDHVFEEEHQGQKVKVYSVHYVVIAKPA